MKSDFIFEESKAGELTCSFKGKYLHSKYNPKTEGERFAQSLEADFSPLCLFILEPALSYCASSLKVRFPQATVCAVRFRKEFSESDSEWDKVFYLCSDLPLSEQLFLVLGEEKLCSSLVFDWSATKQAFPEENIKAWQEIKKAILKARDVIGTRAYFSKRWLKNSLVFAANIERPFILEKGNQPVIIAASGPSLKSSLPFLKENRASFFLIAVSSAFMPLVKNGILPDLVISSDGGFWAKYHLDFEGTSECFFALEAESAIPKRILTDGNVIPLVYDDGLEKDFLDAIACPYMISERNGTVAGTALTFAYNLTAGKVYLCGLDQAAAKGYQHTQPNALENGNAKKDYRLKNSETRMTSSRFSSEKTLEIYRNWFISNSAFFSDRVFRLSDNFAYDYPLGKIKEVNWNDFYNNKLEVKKDRDLKKIQIKEEKIRTEKKERSKKLLERLRNISKSQNFINEVFPMESTLIRRELSEEKRRDLLERLREKTDSLLEECAKLLQAGL